MVRETDVRQTSVRLIQGSCSGKFGRQRHSYRGYADEGLADKDPAYRGHTDRVWQTKIRLTGVMQTEV